MDKQKRRSLYEKNKAKIYASHRKWVEKNRKKYLEYHREYSKRNLKRRRELYKENILKERKRDREHYHKTRERHRELRISLAYGITVEEYRSLHERSKGVCEICGKPEKEINKRYGNPKVLSVDHNHITGKVRGVLCANCNSAVGLLHEDLGLLEKIREYLLKYAQTT